MQWNNESNGNWIVNDSTILEVSRTNKPKSPKFGGNSQIYLFNGTLTFAKQGLVLLVVVPIRHGSDTPVTRTVRAFHSPTRHLGDEDSQRPRLAGRPSLSTVQLTPRECDHMTSLMRYGRFTSTSRCNYLDLQVWCSHIHLS